MSIFQALKRRLFPIGRDAQGCADFIRANPDAVSVQLREFGRRIHVLAGEYTLTIAGGRVTMVRRQATTLKCGLRMNWNFKPNLSRRDERMLLSLVIDWMQTDDFGPVALFKA